MLFTIAVSYCFLLFIVWTIGIIRYKKLTTAFKVLTWSVLFIFILAILSYVFASKYRNNRPIIHLECITGYLFYGMTYYYLFKNVIIKKTIIISIIIITVFFIYNAIFLQPFNKVFPSNVFIPTQTLYVIFSLLLFKEMLLYPLDSNIIKQSIFWYNTGIFFYSTTLFITLGITNYLAKQPKYDPITTYLWYFVLFAFHILIGVSFLTDNKEITSKCPMKEYV
jgi:hypothetical protein